MTPEDERLFWWVIIGWCSLQILAGLADGLLVWRERRRVKRILAESLEVKP